jgi:hypothetical protein
MILCSSGFYIAFHISLQSIKHTQRQIILSSDLKNKFIFEFAFSKDASTYKRQGISFIERDEIKYKGKMYDIVSQHDTTDSIFVKCISDEQEDYTIALSQNELIKNQNAKNEKDLSILKFNLGVYTFPDTGIPKFSLNKETLSHQFFHPGKLLFTIINVPSPPPWH